MSTHPNPGRTAPRPTDPPPPEHTNPYDLLRMLRVEVQAIQSLLADMRAGLIARVDATPWLRQRIVRGDLLMDLIETAGGRPAPGGNDASALPTRLRNAITAFGLALAAAQPPATTGPMIALEAISYLRDTWERITSSPLLRDPAPTPAPTPEERVHYLTLLDTHCRQIVFECCFWTIPATLDDWLAGSRVGYYIPFHSVFDDELPLQEDRVKMLNYLAWSPNVVQEGLIDVGTGLVYRFSKSRIRQVVSLVMMLAVFALVSGFVAYAAHLHAGVAPLTIRGLTLLPRTPAWQIAKLPTTGGEESTMIVGWGALFTGILIHVAVAATKRMQTQAAAPPVIAVANFLPVINAKLGPILLKLLLALFGFFGLLFAMGADKATLLNFFLTGYTLDSVVELFGATAEQRAGAQVTTLKQQINGTQPTAASSG